MQARPSRPSRSRRSSRPPPPDPSPDSCQLRLPAPPSKGTVTFAFDAFATYYPGIIIDVKGLLKKRGYDLALVPFGFNGMNDVTEDQRWAKLKSGEYDVLASTLDGFSRVASPDVGSITALIDESAGADKIVGRPEITSINDLKGKKIAFSKGSVSEYFLYYALKLAGMTPQDVTLLPQESTEDAVYSLYRRPGRRAFGLGAECARCRGQGCQSDRRIG